MHGLLLTIALVTGASGLENEIVTLSEINGRWNGRCVMAGQMINWCLDDELWRHPGFLTAACCIDGTTNDGNNEGRFRRMLDGRDNRSICASLHLSYN